jgi:hypothetical protein
MKHSIKFLLFVSFCLIAKLYFQQKEWIKIPVNQDLKPVLASYQSNSVEKYALGFNSLIGASIWVQLLQKSDHRPVPDEKVSWEFSQLDTLTTVDPNNNRAYDFGSIFISVLRRDKLGGKLLLEKWTKKRPDFWRPWYLLGSHYSLELHDYALAAPLIIKASKMANAPSWLSSLGIRLLSESGQYFQALKTSLELFPIIRDPEGRTRLSHRIRALNYSIQKKYWQNALDTYLSESKHFPSTIADLEPQFNHQKRELSSLTDSDHEKDETLVRLMNESFQFNLSPNKKEVVSSMPSETKNLESIGIYIPPSEKEINPK